MNMFGGHGSGGYLGPGAPPMEVDLLSLLKNYNPHDLAALYQHWGYVDPRFEPQGKERNAVGFCSPVSGVSVFCHQHHHTNMFSTRLKVGNFVLV